MFELHEYPFKAQKIGLSHTSIKLVHHPTLEPSLGQSRGPYHWILIGNRDHILLYPQCVVEMTWTSSGPTIMQPSLLVWPGCDNGDFISLWVTRGPILDSKRRRKTLLIESRNRNRNTNIMSKLEMHAYQSI